MLQASVHSLLSFKEMLAAPLCLEQQVDWSDLAHRRLYFTSSALDSAAHIHCSIAAAQGLISTVLIGSKMIPPDCGSSSVNYDIL